MYSQKRFVVPDAVRDWETAFPEYQPIEFTDAEVFREPRGTIEPMDRDIIENHTITFNKNDGKVDRTRAGNAEHADGKIKTNKQMLPLNPRGRTGVTGRGVLRRWGPNHAAEPIATRWRRKGPTVVKDTYGHPVLEMLLVQRRSDGAWAIPGRILDSAVKGIMTNDTVRDFIMFLPVGCDTEDDVPRAVRVDLKRHLNEIFSSSTEVYANVINDPRNTDNAWVEATTIRYHDESGDSTKDYSVQLAPHMCGEGSEWKSAKWIEINPDTVLCTAQEEILIGIREELIVKQLNLKGKKRLTFFKKWHKLRRTVQEDKLIATTTKTCPENMAIKHLHRRREWYKALPEEKQRVVLRCVQTALKAPRLWSRAYAYALDDYTTAVSLFAEICEEEVGISEKTTAVKNELALHHGSALSNNEAGSPHRCPAPPVLDFNKMGLPWIKTEFTCIRNVARVPFIPEMCEKHRTGFENWVCAALTNAKGGRRKGKLATKIVGTYYSFTPDHENYVGAPGKTKRGKRMNELETSGLMPTYFRQFIAQAQTTTVGFARDTDVPPLYLHGWPHGRGIFLSEDSRFSIVIGCLDHVHIHYQHQGYNLLEPYTRCTQIADLLGHALLETGSNWDEGLQAMQGQSADPYGKTAAEALASKSMQELPKGNKLKAAAKRALEAKRAPSPGIKKGSKAPGGKRGSTEASATASKDKGKGKGRRKTSSKGARGGKASTSSVAAVAPDSAGKETDDSGPAQQDSSASGAGADREGSADGDADSSTQPDKKDSVRTTGDGDDVRDVQGLNDSGALPGQFVDESPWAHTARFGFVATDPLQSSKGVRVLVRTSIKMVCQLSPEELADFCKALNLVIRPTINRNESTDDRIYVLTVQPIAHFAQEPSCIMMLLHDGMKSLKKMVANYIPKKNRRDQGKGKKGLGGKKKKSAESAQPKSKVASRIGTAKSRTSQQDGAALLQPERISSALSRISRINTARERRQMQLGSAGSRIQPDGNSPNRHASLSSTISSKASQDDTASEKQAPKRAKTPAPSSRRRSKQPAGSPAVRPPRRDTKESGRSRGGSIEQPPVTASTVGPVKDLSGKKALPPIAKAPKRGSAATTAAAAKRKPGQRGKKVPVIMTWSSSDSEGAGSDSDSDTDSDSDSDSEGGSGGDGGGGGVRPARKPAAPAKKLARKPAKQPAKPPAKKLVVRKPAKKPPPVESSGTDDSDSDDSDFGHF